MALPFGQGDFTDPRAMQDQSGNIPPQQFSQVPQNINFPQNGDGRYWFTGNAQAPAPGVLALLHFNDPTSSKTPQDTLFNTQWALSSPAAIQDSIVKFGSGAVHLDGQAETFNGIMSTPLSPGSVLDFGTDSWTIEFFLYVPSGQSGGCIFDTGYESGPATDPISASDIMDLSISNAGAGLSFTYSYGGGGAIGITSGLPTNTWMHIAIVYNSAAHNIVFYFNGTASATNAIPANTSFSPSSARTWFWGLNGQCLNAANVYIDEMRLSNVAQYTANFTPPIQPFGELPASTISFIGNSEYLTGEAQISWTEAQLSSDGSIPTIFYSTDGSTFQNVDLPVNAQGLQSGAFNVDLTGATAFLFGMGFIGAFTEGATLSEIALAVTRNEGSQPVWDQGANGLDANGLNPINYNGEVQFESGYDTLLTLQSRMLIRLGFSNQLAAPPPGMQTMTQEFLQSAQNYLYRKFTQLRTRRWFRWKINPLQRFYSLMDNDENVLEGYSLDTDKTIEQVMVQDTRNVWYPLTEGIPGQLYTMLPKPWRPARYDIRNCIEIYPAPDQTYFLWVKGHFGLLSFQNPSDQTTIDSELVFLHALANAKAHYGQPDASNIEAQANALRGNLIAATHKTAKYVPGTVNVPPAVRPTLIQFQGGESGTS